MTRTLSAAIGCWLLFAGAALAQLHPPVAEFAPAERQQASIALLPAGASSGATELVYSADCVETSPRQGLIALAWNPVPQVTWTQRIDVTKFREGFDIGRFDTSEALAPEVTTVSLQNPEPGIYYYWRVLSETPSGWTSSTIGRFEAPICPSDGPVFRNEE